MIGQAVDCYSQYRDALNQANAQANAANALGGLGLQQGLAGTSNQYRLGSFAQGMVADAYRHAASFKPEVPLTRYDGMTDKLVPVTQEWIEETQRVQSDLAKRLTEANREIARLTILFAPPIVTEEPAPDASRIWEAIVAYSSR